MKHSAVPSAHSAPYRRQQIGPTPAPSLGWALTVTGLVAIPSLWTADALDRLPTAAYSGAIVCTMSAAAPLATTPWSGAAAAALIAAAVPLTTARYVHCAAADGYTTVLPLSIFATGLIARAADQAALSPADGAPARLIVPGQAGYKQIKWLTRLTFSASTEGGWWESRGYPLAQPAPAACRVIAPVPHQRLPVGQPVTLHGTAVHADRVWVSINDSAPLSAALTTSTDGLQHWSIDWIPPYLGDHVVRVWVNNQQTGQTCRVSAV